MREALDGDARQRSGTSILRLHQCRHHYLVEQHRTRHRNAVESLVGADSAQDILGGDALLLSCQFITTTWPANAFEDAVAHQGLQHRLEVPWRPPMSGRQHLGRYGPATRIERDIDDRGDRQNTFAGQKRHEQTSSWREHRDKGLCYYSCGQTYPSRTTTP